MARGQSAGTSLLFNSSPIVVSPPLTIAVWFKSESVLVKQAIVSMINTSSFNEYHVLLAHGGGPLGPRVTYELRHLGTTSFVRTTADYSVNTWHHAAATIELSGVRQSCYLDGGNKQSLSFLPVIPTGIDQTRVFRQGVVANINPFFGSIGEVAVWSTELLDNEIVTLASGRSPSSVRSGSLANYWPLYDESSPEKDYSSNNSDLSQSGGLSFRDNPPVSFPFAWDTMKLGVKPEDVEGLSIFERRAMRGVGRGVMRGVV